MNGCENGRCGINGIAPFNPSEEGYQEVECNEDLVMSMLLHKAAYYQAKDKLRNSLYNEITEYFKAKKLKYGFTFKDEYGYNQEADEYIIRIKISIYNSEKFKDMVTLSSDDISFFEDLICAVDMSIQNDGVELVVEFSDIITDVTERKCNDV